MEVGAAAPPKTGTAPAPSAIRGEEVVNVEPAAAADDAAGEFEGGPVVEVEVESDMATSWSHPTDFPPAVLSPPSAFPLPPGGEITRGAGAGAVAEPDEGAAVVSKVAAFVPLAGRGTIAVPLVP